MCACVGVLQPVREVVKAVRDHERETGRQQRILIHTDAAQVSYVLLLVPLDCNHVQ